MISIVNVQLLVGHGKMVGTIFKGDIHLSIHLLSMNCYPICYHLLIAFIFVKTFTVITCMIRYSSF